MKRDVKSLLFVALAAVNRPSSSFDDAPLACPFDIREDLDMSTSFDVVDDSILAVDGIPMNSIRWS
jgi:hypothetical protein